MKPVLSHGISRLLRAAAAVPSVMLVFALAPMSAPAAAGDTAAASAPAGSCEDRAVDKNGKKLAGAAKASFLKKCEAESAASSCEDKAIDKNGKKLAGAAKSSFVKKCEADAKK